MKFSENWLRTIVNPPLASRELADVLLMSGIDVEAVEPAAPACENVVVAEVIEVQKHPDAERLTVCRVNAGGAPLTVVCGAENVAAGMRVPLARAGARLSGIEIKKTKVRGVESSGMLCSAKELGLAEDVPVIGQVVEDRAEVGVHRLRGDGSPHLGRDARMLRDELAKGQVELRCRHR